MGTRCVTHLYEMEELGGKLVCSFYRQYDGYVSGHGEDLKTFFKGKSLTNGYSSEQEPFMGKTIFNRSGSLAVKLMNFIQDESGCEVIPTDDKASHGQDYTYYIYPKKDKSIFIKVECFGTVVYEGNIENMVEIEEE